jgi:hypothetical protein
MFLLSGLGVTAEDSAERRRVVSELLRPLEHPQLIQVAADGWTVQEMVDLCLEAQGLVPKEVPCVWLAR